MSTSIYKPLGLSLSANIPDRRMFYRSEVRKVKRALFEPEDHHTTQRFIDEELEKITVTQSTRWNFNFKTEKTLDPDGIYKWSPVTPQKTIIPIKKPIENDSCVEELYARPDDILIVRPIPHRPVQDEEMKSPPKPTMKSQRPITGKSII